MKYYELQFSIKPFSETATDILSALLADTGFETFLTEPLEPNGSGPQVFKAYVQQTLFSEAAVKDIVAGFPLEGIGLKYTVQEPEYKDWNETWENEGFEPITVDNRLVVCDTKHLDFIDRNAFDYRILIHPRQAFGTGAHETTRMLLSTLLDMPLKNKKIIDAGCGTGILSFLCLLLEPKLVISYDIDEWSTENTKQNALLNFNEEQGNALTPAKWEVRLGDSSTIATESDLDLLIANINRNILLADMATFAHALKPKGAQLLLSGFYKEDVPSLLKEAGKYGLKLERERHDGEWTMLLLCR